MELTQFLDRHKACPDGRKRAAAFASLEDAWQSCTPADLIWAATRPGVLTDKELRRFSVFCARSVEHIMEDPRSVAAIDVAERHAGGLATDDELRAAHAYAADAAHAATYAAHAAASATAAALAAAARAAYASAARAAYASAANAAYDAAAALAAAARAAARAATRSASDVASAAVVAREQQAAWLRQNTKPNFS